MGKLTRFRCRNCKLKNLVRRNRQPSRVPLLVIEAKDNLVGLCPFAPLPTETTKLSTNAATSLPSTASTINPSLRSLCAIGSSIPSACILMVDAAAAWRKRAAAALIPTPTEDAA